MAGGTRDAARAAVGRGDAHADRLQILVIAGAVARGGRAAEETAHLRVAAHRTGFRRVTGGLLGIAVAHQAAHRIIAGDLEVLDGVAVEVLAIGLLPALNAAHIAVPGHQDLHILRVDIVGVPGGIGDQAAGVIIPAGPVGRLVLHQDVGHLHTVHGAAGGGNKAEVGPGVLAAQHGQPVNDEIAGAAEVQNGAGHGAGILADAEIKGHILKGQVLHIQADLGDPGLGLRSAVVAEVGEPAGGAAALCRGGALQTAQHQLPVFSGAVLEVHGAGDLEVLAGLAVARLHHAVPGRQIGDLPIVDVGGPIGILIGHHNGKVPQPPVFRVLYVKAVGVQGLFKGLGGDLDLCGLAFAAAQLDLRLFIFHSVGGDVHAVERNAQGMVRIGILDPAGVDTGVGQPGHQVIAAAVVPIVHGFLHPQRRIAALAGQEHILLLPAVPPAVVEQLRGTASGNRVIVPVRTQADGILPGVCPAQLLAGEQAVGPAVVGVGQLARHLLLIGVNRRNQIGSRLAYDTVRIGARAGYIAQGNGVGHAVALAGDAAGIVTGGLQDVHIGKASADVGSVAGGNGAVDAAHEAAVGLDGAVGIAGLDGAGGIVAHQAANAVDDGGVGDVHSHVVGVAAADLSGTAAIAHQSAGIQGAAHLNIRQGAVRCGAALQRGSIRLTHQDAQIAAAGDGAVPHPDILQPCLVGVADDATEIGAHGFGSADDRVLDQQVPDRTAIEHGAGIGGGVHAVIRTADTVDQVGIGKPLQADAAEHMLLAVQLAPEDAAAAVAGLGAVQDHLGRSQRSAGEV